jgi:hypothetical protein
VAHAGQSWAGDIGVEDTIATSIIGSKLRSRARFMFVDISQRQTALAKGTCTSIEAASISFAGRHGAACVKV